MRAGSPCAHRLLDAPRPADLHTVVERLTFLQVDPTAAIAPSADLVAWSRLGSSYRPEQLTRALEHDRTLFEHDALVRPVRDLPIVLARAADWPVHDKVREWLRANDSFRRDVLKLLGSPGARLSEGRRPVARRGGAAGERAPARVARDRQGKGNDAPHRAGDRR